MVDGGLQVAKDHRGDLRNIADHPGRVDGAGGGDNVHDPPPKALPIANHESTHFVVILDVGFSCAGKKLLCVRHGAEAGFRDSDGK